MSIRKFLGFILGCGASIVWFTTCLDLTGPNYFNADGDTLVLNYGESATARSGGIRITFSDVLEDGRCPSNVVCCWEGIAKIKITLKERLDKTTNIVLPIYGYVSIENSLRHVAVDTLGYRLMLMQLDPYPEDPVEPEFYASYQATIFIEINQEK